MRRSGFRQADALQPLQCLGARRVAFERGVALDHFDDLRADAQHRIQARRRLLKDDADAASAHVAHARFGQRSDIHAGQVDPAGVDSAVVGQQPQNRKRSHRFAATRLADQRESFAALDRQRQRIDRTHQAGIGVEYGAKTLDGKRRVPGCPLALRAVPPRGTLRSLGRPGETLTPLPSAAVAAETRVRADRKLHALRPRRNSRPAPARA